MSWLDCLRDIEFRKTVPEVPGTYADCRKVAGPGKSGSGRFVLSRVGLDALADLTRTGRLRAMSLATIMGPLQR
jgi:hypothetical protein